MSGSLQMDPPFGHYFKIEPSKRRHLSSSDQEIKEEMDDRDTFRKGWPTLLALPLRSVTASQEEQDLIRGKHLDNIREVLARQNLVVVHYHVCHRTRPSPEALPDDTTLTLLLIVNDFQGAPYYGVVETRKYLKSVDIHMNIEIFRQCAYPDQTIYPVGLPDDREIVEGWSTSKKDVMSTLTNSTLQWSIVSVFRFGVEEKQHCRPTMLVRSPTPEVAEWHDMRLRLKQILGKDWQVVIRWGEFLRRDDYGAKTTVGMSDSYQSAKAFDVSSLSNDVKIGVSGAASGSWNSGTLGAGLRLEKDGVDQGLFFLTRHHCVEEDELSGYRLLTQNETPLRPTHKAVIEKTFPVVYPSDPDTNARIKFLEEAKEQQTIREAQLAPYAGLGKKGNDESLALVTSKLTRFTHDLNKLRSWNRVVGHVYAGSSRRLVTSQLDSQDNWLLDWALVKAAPTKSATNQLYDVERFTELETYVAVRGDRETAETWRDLTIGEKTTVMKRGRTTEWTDGTTNGIRSLIWLHYAQKMISCIEVIGDSDFPFARTGDSGSIVLEAKMKPLRDRDCHAWLGVVFGTDIQRSTFVMPMQIVMEDIERVTGCKVTWPEKQ